MNHDEPTLVIDTAPPQRTPPPRGSSGPPAQPTDLERILATPRIPLGQWPTPIETRLHRGHKIQIKRDDLSGFGRGGAKTRKIEHVFGLMRARGHDELITLVGNITNLGFDLLPALRAHGFSARIFVQDDPPLPAAKRRECFRGIETELRFLGRSRIAATGRVCAEWLRRRAAGRRPFLLLPGASHPAGVIGNACGFIEMTRQLREAGEPLPKRVYVSAATGTTIAGFLIAENALRAAGFPPIDIVGVQVYPGDIDARTRWLLRWTERHLALAHAIDPARIDIRPEMLGGGFGAATPELENLCARVQVETQLALDPIFGGKTWSVLERDLASDRAGERPVMFWHCGYTPEWRPLVASVRASASRRPPATSAATGGDEEAHARPRLRKLAIIAAYVAVFYGALPLFLRGFGLRLDALLALPPIENPLARGLGGVVVALGALIVLASIVSFARIGRGLPMSHLPPKRLVNLSVYRWTRHPHYVGYNLAIAGWGLLAGSWGLAVGSALLLLACWLIYALIFEDPRLERKFGGDYANYRACVRVLPVPSPYRLFQFLVTRGQAPLHVLANRLVLARTGDLLWVTFGLFGGLGAAAMGGVFAWFLIDHGAGDPLAAGGVAVLASMITLGSRGAWFVLPGDKPLAPWRQMLRRVGFVSWGGYVAAFVTGIALGRTVGVSALRMLDAVMCTGMLASMISRWGCFSYGCCIGRPVAWGVRWTHPDAWIHRLRPGSDAPRIPTQLLSSWHAGIAALALFALSLAPSAPGSLAAIGGLLYALPRFAVEELREEARVGSWQMTTGQLGCGAVFVLSVALLFVAPATPGPFWNGTPMAGHAAALLTAAATAFAIVFVAYGAHWKRIGRW